MSEGAPSPAATPLARLLFGWAYRPRIGRVLLIALGAACAGLLALEAARRREGLGLFYENEFGFYAAIAGGGAAAVAALARALAPLLLRPAAEEEDENEREAGDADDQP